MNSSRPTHRAIPCILISLLCVIGGLTSSCGELVFDEPGTTNPTDTTQTGTVPTDTTEYISVAKALELPELSSAMIRGYIVGYISGTRLSQVRFDVPTEKANTNIVIADRRDETNLQFLMPVRLDAKSSFRTFLNLYEHPELLHRRVLIAAGSISTYFGTNGITGILGVKLLSDEGEDQPDDTPNLPQTPGISDDPTYVEEGR